MRIKGWVNVDLASGDVRADLRSLPFADDSSGAVLLCHVVEHFTYSDAWKVLREANRVLRRGGLCLVEGPDLEKIIEFCSMNVKDLSRNIYGVIPENGTMGDCHKSGWTTDLMKEAMEESGFAVTETGRGKLHGRQWRDFRVVGRK